MVARNDVARYMGFVSRTTTKERCVDLQYHHHHSMASSSSSSSSRSGGGGVMFLGVQSAGKLIDIYRVRCPDEAARKRKKRLSGGRTCSSFTLFYLMIAPQSVADGEQEWL